MILIHKVNRTALYYALRSKGYKIVNVSFISQTLTWFFVSICWRINAIQGLNTMWTIWG